MSSRNYRKLRGNSGLSHPDEESDSGYQPVLAQSTLSSMYSGLQSTIESEKLSTEGSEEEPIPKPPPTPQKKKSKKKGKGKSSKPKNDLKMDEIEQSIKELDAQMNNPPPAASTSAEPRKPRIYPAIMKISPINLNVNLEFKQMFGARGSRRLRNENYLLLFLKRVLVLPMGDTLIYDYKNSVGLSMSIERQEEDVIYFVFDHSPERQKVHQDYLKFAKQKVATSIITLEETRSSMHIEGLLGLSEAMFRLNEPAIGNEIIQNVVAYLQYVAHPAFNLAADNVRLEYKYWENRPFHVAFLKFIYLLTNMACHRTALELAKMLLNLDPSDPLAILIIIDSLALRAREFEWLLSAIDHFAKEREAGLLFNMQYSQALALFQTATKNKSDTKEADKVLQDAILAYPGVVPRILEYCNVPNSTISAHELFKPEPRSFATNGLNVLMFIYTKLSYVRYREHTVLNWLVRNAMEMATKYDNDPEVKQRAIDLVSLRHGLFQVWPAEVLRHLGVIKFLAPVVFDENLPQFNRYTCGWDPLQDGGINRYGYPTLIYPPHNMGPSGSTLYRLFSSMLPSYSLNNDSD